MARSSPNSLLNTLRGKIWISTSVLAFFICTFGLISYLVVTLLTNNPFYGVFIPFLLLAFSVIVFGWWLSNELVNPIENVILLSKSLERNSATSLPKTSGSTETDQLLQTLHRNSQQMQNVVALMDKVANGNIDIALTPLKGSDRLTTSFQKLLSKVSESIHAKEELNKLEAEINLVKSEVSSVRSGNLNVELNSDYFQTKEITETIKYLIENFTLLINLIRVDSHQAKFSADDVEKTLETLIEVDEKNIQKITQASMTLKEVPKLIEKITSDITRSAKSAKSTIEKTRHGAEISQENSASVRKLRGNLRESISRIQSLNERSQEIAKVARIVDDLANRTNMIALNASIQATELGEDGKSFVLVSQELERLAARANGTNKQISMLNNTILSEIGRVEDSLESTMGEVANLSKYTIETGNVLSELERYVGQFLNLQDNLITYSNDQSEKTNEAFKTVDSSISVTEISIKDLSDSSKEIKNISLLMKNLQSHTAMFRISNHELASENPQFDVSQIESDNSQNIEEPTNADENELNEEYSTKEFEKVRLSNQELKDMTMKSEESSLPDFSSDEFKSAEFSSFDINSADFNSRDTNSDEFDLKEFHTNNMNSDNFDSKDFYKEEFKSLEDSGKTLDSVNLEDSGKNIDSVNNDATDFLNESFASDSFDSSEFVKDDLDIDTDIIANENLLDGEDLLNLKSNTSQDTSNKSPA